MTPIAVSARMMQCSIAWWQAMAILQKRWFDSFMPLANADLPAPHEPTPEAPVVEDPAPLLAAGN